MSYITLALYDYLDDLSFINEVIETFVCDINKDIEDFLKTKALYLEKNNFSRTYLVFNNEMKPWGLVGYYTIALKNIDLDIDISNSFRKMISGYTSKKEAIIYLIGQIGKNTAISSNYQIDGRELMSNAFATIYNAFLLVGGRTMLVECENQEKLKDFYVSFGFRYLCENPDNRLLQYVSSVKFIH